MLAKKTSKNQLTLPLEAIKDKLEKLGIGEGDVAGAVEWARKKK